MNYRDIITIEPGKRSGKPCIRGLRITVYDVLDLLAAGMSEKDILADYPDLSVRVGKDAIAVRELLVHRIEEYARHCGHADLLRECIDGRVGQ